MPAEVEKISTQKLLSVIRSDYPELSKFGDTEVVQQILKAYPMLRRRVVDDKGNLAWNGETGEVLAWEGSRKQDGNYEGKYYLKPEVDPSVVKDASVGMGDVRRSESDSTEKAFQSWYRSWAEKAGIDTNPDNPEHKYDYRAAYRAGVIPEINRQDGRYHWPSEFKADDHPNRYIGGVDTKAGKPIPVTAQVGMGDVKKTESSALPKKPQPKAATAGIGDLRVATAIQSIPPERHLAALTRLEESVATPSVSRSPSGVMAQPESSPSGPWEQYQKSGPWTQYQKKTYPGRAVNPARDLVASPPQESTLGSRAREAAIGVLSPFTIPALAETAKTIGKTAADLISANPMKGVGELKELASGMYHATVDPLKDYVRSVGAGDWDAAALASGQILSQTAPAVAGAVEGVVKRVPSIGKLKETARGVAQSKVAPSAVRGVMEKFGKEAEAAKSAQVASDADVAQKNLAAQQAAQQKNVEGQLTYDVKTGEASAEAARKTAEAEALAAGKTAENKAQTAAQIEQNRLAQQGASRAESIGRSLQEGSQVLGERTKNLDSLLREEGNGKYQEVRDAVKDDPGVPLQDLAEAARHAEQNILKGSQESIKQLRELARKAPEDEGVVSGGVTFPPGSSLFEMLKEQGAIDTGGNISFGDLQGYSSEIGRKLAAGNLPGDVYQALKYLKDKIDGAKSVIADRNGAGGLLRQADNFWRNYMDLLYDKESALTKVRESVGTLDPKFYAEAFTKGKAGDVAIGKLKSLKSVYAKEAAAVGDLARNLRAAGTELEGIPAVKVKPVTPPQTVTAAPVAPVDVVPPKPVPTKTFPQDTVPQPKPPTVEELSAAKRAEATRTAENLGRLRPYDVAILAGSPLGLLLPTWGKIVGLAAEAARFGVPMAMKSEAFLDFISKPTARDLALVEKLPEPALAELKANLQREIAARNQQGPTRLTVAPAIQRILSKTGTTSGGVKSRRDALEVLGQPTP